MRIFAIKSPGASYRVESLLDLGPWIGEPGGPFVGDPSGVNSVTISHAKEERVVLLAKD
ncbi:hypothetical protein N9096_00180 [bacterium]|nr:hypothetical protein [Akkermansiaceae bacterium]MDB4512371.1 hypothetical protein [bacterium]MDB4754375.1 hypothetical protein [Akkermansiaceae bacterium]MDC0270326.1 hypothetical protein [bacterium]